METSKNVLLPRALPRPIAVIVFFFSLTATTTRADDVSIEFRTGPTLNFGQVLQLQATSTSSSVHVATWMKDGKNICDSSDISSWQKRTRCIEDILYIEDLRFEDAGRYCAAIPGGGTSADVNVVIRPIFTLPTAGPTANTSTSRPSLRSVPGTVPSTTVPVTSNGTDYSVTSTTSNSRPPTTIETDGAKSTTEANQVLHTDGPQNATASWHPHAYATSTGNVYSNNQGKIDTSVPAAASALLLSPWNWIIVVFVAVGVAFWCDE